MKINSREKIHQPLQAGFSLVELMVAIVLGLVLMAGVIQVFLGNRQAQRSDSASARVQESGRLALDLISTDLRAAGFLGCPVLLGFEKGIVGGAEIKKHGSDFDFVSTSFADASVRGYEHPSAGSWSSKSPVPSGWSSGFISEAKVGSDVLALYFGDAGKARVTANVPASGAIPASIDNNNDYFRSIDGVTAPVIISNCKTADIFRLSSQPGASGSISLSHAAGLSTDEYDEHSKLMRFVENVYFVRDTGRKNPAGNPIFSLYRLSDGVSDELVEGIEFMQVQFGEKLDSNNVRFVSANDASLDPSRIVSVKIGLLAQSYDEVGTQEDTKTYEMPGQKIDGSTTTVKHGTDKTIRKMFTATIELRNRLQL